MIVNILDGKVAYYHAPKCGSRTVIGWAVLLKEPQIFDEHPEWFAESKPTEYNEIRNKILLFKASRHDWNDYKVPAVNADIRFCILRDPVERFISSYVFKVLYRQTRTGFLGKMSKINISTFIENFDRIHQTNGDIRVHFMPQVRFYGKNSEIFTHIFNLNQMNNVKQMLENISGVQLPDLHLQQSGGIRKPILSPAEMQWIRNKYKDDCVIYDTWPRIVV